MAIRRIRTADRELERLLEDIQARLDRLDGGNQTGVWPSFPEKILIGDGALVIRHTTDVNPLNPPDEIELLLFNPVTGNSLSLGTVN